MPGGSMGSGATMEAASGTGGSASNDAADVAPDTTAPTVVSVTPSNGTRGVAKDVSIVVVFSEPMDQGKTEMAYASSSLPASGVTFSWSADKTQLTIDPKSDLAYAIGSATTLEPMKYAFAIGTGASDLAGNAMGQAYAVEFATSRRIEQKLTGSIWSIYHEEGIGRLVANCTELQIPVGDSGAGFVAGALFEFDISALPAEVQLFEKATLEAIQKSFEGMPFGATRLGEIVCDHVHFAPTDSASLLLPALQRLGTFSDSVLEGPRQMSVVTAIADDYEKRATRVNRSQYRISFSKANPDTVAKSVTYECTAGMRPTLSLTYLLP
jgi:hypothetical protein